MKKPGRGGSSKMTQSRSSILLVLAVMMAVVVESSTQNIDKVDNAVNNRESDNQTQYHLDIQTNFIDSELKENENDIQEHPEEPVPIEHEQEFIIPSDKDNATERSGNGENSIINDILIPDVQQMQESANETNKNVSNSKQTAERDSLETTTVPILDETITTLVPISANALFIDSTLSTTDSTPIEMQTKSSERLQETTTNYNYKKT